MSFARHSSPMRSTHACLRSLMSLAVERRVVEQDLEAVGARFLQPPDGPVVEQVPKPARRVRVVAGLLVREQEAGALRAALARGEAPFGIEQDGARVLGQHLGHERLELFHLAIADLAAFFLRERLLQRAALVHGRRRNHAALVRDGLHSCQLARCHFHRCVCLCPASPEGGSGTSPSSHNVAPDYSDSETLSLPPSVRTDLQTIILLPGN